MEQTINLRIGLTVLRLVQLIKIYPSTALFFEAGMSKQKTVGKWDVTFLNGYLPPKDDGSLDGNLFEFENKFNIKYKLNERTSIYNIGEFYSLQGQKFYRGK